MSATSRGALLPIAEVARRWHCSERHVYRLINVGQLRVVQLGIGRAKSRVPESALDEFIEKNQHRARGGLEHVR